MYVSYTPPRRERRGGAAGGAKIPCMEAEADARTRTGDPFITRKAGTPDARARQATPAPIRTAIPPNAGSDSRPLPRTPETATVYVSYTPTPLEHCLGCGRRLRLSEPGPLCATCIDARREATTEGGPQVPISRELPGPSAREKFCDVDGCEARHPRSHMMCRRHWLGLPKPLRDEVWASIREDGLWSGRYEAAREAAFDHWSDR
jgi:hypothetical protein